MLIIGKNVKINRKTLYLRMHRMAQIIIITATSRSSNLKSSKLSSLASSINLTKVAIHCNYIGRKRSVEDTVHAITTISFQFF